MNLLANLQYMQIRIAFDTVSYTGMAPAYPCMNAFASALLLEIQMQDP